MAESLRRARADQRFCVAPGESCCPAVHVPLDRRGTQLPQCLGAAPTSLCGGEPGSCANSFRLHPLQRENHSKPSGKIELTFVLRAGRYLHGCRPARRSGSAARPGARWRNWKPSWPNLNSRAHLRSVRRRARFWLRRWNGAGSAAKSAACGGIHLPGMPARMRAPTGACRQCCLRAAFALDKTSGEPCRPVGPGCFCPGENKKGALFALLFCVACRAATFN